MQIIGNPKAVRSVQWGKVSLRAEDLTESDTGFISANTYDWFYDIPINEVDPSKCVITESIDVQRSYGVTFEIKENLIRVWASEDYNLGPIYWKLLEYEKVSIQRGVSYSNSILFMPVDASKSVFIMRAARSGTKEFFPELGEIEVSMGTYENHSNVHWEVITFG